MSENAIIEHLAQASKSANIGLLPASFNSSYRSRISHTFYMAIATPASVSTDETSPLLV
jgi:hypothetical protein